MNMEIIKDFFEKYDRKHSYSEAAIGILYSEFLFEYPR